MVVVGVFVIAALAVGVWSLITFGGGGDGGGGGPSPPYPQPPPLEPAHPPCCCYKPNTPSPKANCGQNRVCRADADCPESTNYEMWWCADHGPSPWCCKSQKIKPTPHPHYLHGLRASINPQFQGNSLKNSAAHELSLHLARKVGWPWRTGRKG